MKKKERLVDTNNFIRLVIRDDEEKRVIVKNLLKKGASGEISLLIGVHIITEIEKVLKFDYQKTREQRLEVLKTVISMSCLKYTDQKDKEATQLALKYFGNYKIDLEDCYNLAYCKIRDSELFTFDTKLKKIARELDINRMP